MPSCAWSPGVAAALLLGPQLVVADQLERLVERRLVVAGVEDEPGDAVYGNASVGMKLRRRISSGSTPTSRARASMARSMA